MWAGKKIPLEVERCELLAHGPVLTRLAQYPTGPGLEVTTTVTAYPHFEHLEAVEKASRTLIFGA